MEDHEYKADVPSLWEGDKPLAIGVDKAGGGTLGSEYTGTWTVSWYFDGELSDMLILHTGSPKTHAEVAKIYADFLGEAMDTDSDWPLADRLSYWATGLDSDDNEE